MYDVDMGYVDMGYADMGYADKAATASRTSAATSSTESPEQGSRRTVRWGRVRERCSSTVS
ncbi:hypothetical protein [Streptomyces tendae]|uniref:hypothetical protein n=1 Tax=Streptomyces tendae TaxID=1932 RepID=UPI003667F6A4